jgi:long-chain acyl-CoA synthetase
MGLNIAQVVRQWSLREPDRTALVLADEGQRTLSFGELDARACRVAAFLAAQGLAPGARVALSAPNGLGFLEAWFGALYAGLTLLPVPPMSAPPELAHRLAHARCAALITDVHTRALGAEALRLAPGARALDTAELGSESQSADGPRDLPAESVAMILYTSGTTGVAKGAMITHASLATHTAALVHHVLGLTRDDVVLAALPLTHSYGLRMTLLAPFYAGARSVLMARFGAARALNLIAEQGVSWFPGVPTMFHALVHEPATARPEGPSSLRWCLSAGAPLAPDIRTRAEARLGVPVRQGFGLTEATFSTIALPDDAAGADSVGKPVFGVEVRVIDEAGQPLGPGQAGEICVRGQNVMAGYLDDPQATAQVLREGWLRSGDVGMLDAEGRLSVVDRIKDMILRGGFNVYPAEVEAALVSHPSLRDAVVVGVPDAQYGEEVAAVVVPKAGHTLDIEALSAHCRALVSSTKLPRLWGELAALPVGPSGKVLRRAVRAMLLDGKLTLRRTERH